ISENGGKWLQKIQLFDLYEGDHIEEGKKSMAYSLYYANPNATLKEDEVNDDFKRVQKALIDRFNVEIRKAFLCLKIIAMSHCLLTEERTVTHFSGSMSNSVDEIILRVRFINCILFFYN